MRRRRGRRCPACSEVSVDRSAFAWGSMFARYAAGRVPFRERFWVHRLAGSNIAPRSPPVMGMVRPLGVGDETPPIPDPPSRGLMTGTPYRRALRCSSAWLRRARSRGLHGALRSPTISSRNSSSYGEQGSFLRLEGLSQRVACRDKWGRASMRPSSTLATPWQARNQIVTISADLREATTFRIELDSRRAETRT